MTNMTNTEIRIDGARKNLDKANNKIIYWNKRLEKKKEVLLNLGAKVDGYTDADKIVSTEIYQAYYEFEGAKQGLEDAKKFVAECKTKLNTWLFKKETEDERNDVPHIPAVEEFLANWKDAADTYYRTQVKDLIQWKKRIQRICSTEKIKNLNCNLGAVFILWTRK